MSKISTMNERIKELADQAWVYQMIVYEYNGVRTFGEREQVFSKEKFAELIVRECAEIARLNTRVDSKVYLMIQEHFGIE